MTKSKKFEMTQQTLKARIYLATQETDKADNHEKGCSSARAEKFKNEKKSIRQWNMYQYLPSCFASSSRASTNADTNGTSMAV